MTEKEKMIRVKNCAECGLIREYRFDSNGAGYAVKVLCCYPDGRLSSGKTREWSGCYDELMHISKDCPLEDIPVPVCTAEEYIKLKEKEPQPQKNNEHVEDASHYILGNDNIKVGDEVVILAGLRWGDVVKVKEVYNDLLSHYYIETEDRWSIP